MLLFDPQAPCLAAFGSNEKPAPRRGFSCPARTGGCIGKNNYVFLPCCSNAAQHL